MATPEGKVKALVKGILKDIGAYYTMPSTGGYGSSGVPDFVVCNRGRFYGIECKAGKGITTSLQEKHLHEIRIAGGKAIVINELNIDELREYLTK